MEFSAKVSSIKRVDKTNYSFYVLKSDNDKVGICCFAPFDDDVAKKFDAIYRNQEVLNQYEFKIRFGAYKDKNGDYGRCFRIVNIT